MKTVRRTARELVLNVLYQWDAGGVPFDEALETALEFADLSRVDSKGENRQQEVREYARTLAQGVHDSIEELNALINSFATGWPIERQPAVDRNILRIALYEIKHVDSVPPIVAVDEAVELAKKFSTKDSGRFVNGVLAGYLKQCNIDLEGRTPDGGSDS